MIHPCKLNLSSGNLCLTIGKTLKFSNNSSPKSLQTQLTEEIISVINHSFWTLCQLLTHLYFFKWRISYKSSIRTSMKPQIHNPSHNVSSSPTVFYCYFMIVFFERILIYRGIDYSVLRVTKHDCFCSLLSERPQSIKTKN